MDSKQNNYQEDSSFSHNIHKIIALTFLNPNQVISGFERLAIELGDDYETILDYFEESYIGKISILRSIECHNILLF